MATLGIKEIVGALGLVKIASSAFDVMRDGIDQAMSRMDVMDQFQRTMTAITGNTNAASKALDELRAITKGTAYGLNIGAKSVQNFVTRGMEIDQATKRFATWADAVAFYGKGTNEELETVTDALAKMLTKGTVEMEQMNRLTDVGINAVGMYAKATGRYTAEVQEDLTNGIISSEEFVSVVSAAVEEGTNGVLKITGAAKEAGASW
ncbi:tape measure protein [Eubacterium aggregans]|uniref:tape measure protein n=1 Tax=Eubacterium aggregans TaxID=81409 RepID=UPI003F3973C9